jgi:alkylation response protein AidB-like acyl-CoA dehydrogenase
MDFDLSKEQLDIQAAGREFARGEFDPDLALHCDGNLQFPFDIWKKASELGFLGIHYPENYGGQGLGLLENALITESFCQEDSGFGVALALSDFGSEMILNHGNETQKRTILPLLAQGEGLISLAFLEEGYSLAPFGTNAFRDNDGYIVNGKKSFALFGNLADYLIVLCQTKADDPTAQSAFLIEKGTPGVEISSMGETLGMRMVPMSRAFFTQVAVPPEGLLGQKDEAHFQMRDFLHAMRVESGAIGLGIARGALERALEYSKKREQFGKAIATFDAIRNKLADMYVDVEMAKFIVYRAAWSLDQGRPDPRSILMSKLVATRTAYRVAHDAIQIHGGYGYMTEGHIERFFRDAKVLDLFVEPSQAQRNMLADELTVRPNGL